MICDYNLLSTDKKIAILKKELEKIHHEIAISELIYNCHGEDTYEDLFRDNIPSLKDKKEGILLAINNLQENKLNEE
jgi:hypothetical protein